MTGEKQQPTKNRVEPQIKNRNNHTLFQQVEYRSINTGERQLSIAVAITDKELKDEKNLAREPRIAAQQLLRNKKAAIGSACSRETQLGNTNCLLVNHSEGKKSPFGDSAEMFHDKYVCRLCMTKAGGHVQAHQNTPFEQASQQIPTGATASGKPK